MNIKKCIWFLVDFSRAFQSLGFSGAYKLLVKAQFKEATQTLLLKHPTINQFTLRGKTSDWWVFYQIYICKEYPLFESFTPRTIIDAGANIGVTSLFYRKHYPNAEIVALEVDSENHKTLKQNISTDSKIEILDYALWGKETQLRINNPNAANYSFQVEEVENGPIKGVSIDWILKHKEWDFIDVLKIDIEGAEFALFNESSASWLRQTGIILIELHERYQPGCAKRVFDALAEIDYYFKVKANNLVIVNKSIIQNPKISPLFKELFS